MTEPYVPLSTLADGVILVRGSHIRPEPISWLWKGWLARGKLHLLAGAPGLGKTTIALGVAATVTIGGRWPDGSRCGPGNVLIWSGEDDPADTLLPRLISAGADRDRIYFVRGARVDGEELPFDPSRDLVQLCEAAEALGDVRLLIVDPVVSAVAGDTHKNGEVRRALQPLVDLASNLNAAAIGITHLSKGTAGREPTERVTGSIAFTAVVRIVWLAAKIRNDEAEKRILVRSKSNIGPDDGGFEYFIEQSEPLPGIEASSITWGNPIEGTARELLVETDPDEGSGSATDEAADVLKRIIGQDTVPSRDVIAQMRSERFSEKVIRSARERIGVVVKRSGFGKEMTSYWKLPTGTQALTDEPIRAQAGPVVPIPAQPDEWASMGTTGKEGHECGDAEVFE